MSFATPADVVALYGQQYLTESLYGVDASAVQVALDQASSLLLSYVPEGKVMKDPPPLWCKTAEIDIAIYFLSKEVSGPYSAEKYTRFLFWIGKMKEEGINPGDLDDVPASTDKVFSWYSSRRVMSRASTRGLMP